MNLKLFYYPHLIKMVKKEFFKMKSIFINTKSQVGDALTWFVAFLIIFFIMALFISATIIFSAKKRISAGNDEIILKKYSGANLKNQRVLINFLETPLKENKNKNMKLLILDSLEPYLSSLDALKKQNKDINDLIYLSSSSELKLLTEEKNNQLKSEIQKILDKECIDYMLKIPQGIIINNKQDFFSD